MRNLKIQKVVIKLKMNLHSGEKKCKGPSKTTTQKKATMPIKKKKHKGAKQSKRLVFRSMIDEKPSAKEEKYERSASYGEYDEEKRDKYYEK